MDAHIDYHSPRAHVFGTDHPGATRRHHQHLRLPGQGRQVPGAGVGHAHGGVGGLQHQGHRLPHQDAATHHHGPSSGQGHLVAGQQGHHPGWGAATGTGFPLQQAPQVEGVEPVGILFGVDRCEQGLGIQSCRQGQLQQDAIHGWIGIEAADGDQHLLGGCVGRQVRSQVGDANAAAGLFLVGHIDAAGGIIPDPQHRQARGPAGFDQAIGHNGLQPLFEFRRQLATIEDLGHRDARLRRGAGVSVGTRQR